MYISSPSSRAIELISPNKNFALVISGIERLISSTSDLQYIVLNGRRSLVILEDILAYTISTRLLVEGMLKGWYTGVTLYNYITPSRTDYINARRTVNGVDNSKRISLMAEQLEKAIKESK